MYNAVLQILLFNMLYDFLVVLNDSIFVIYPQILIYALFIQ